MKTTKYKNSIKKMHLLPPSNLMEDTDISGFELFIKHIEAGINPNDLIDSDKVFGVKDKAPQ